MDRHTRLLTARSCLQVPACWRLKEVARAALSAPRHGAFGLTCSLSAPTSWSMGRRATWRVAFLNWLCPSLLGSCSCRIMNCSTSDSFR